MSSQDSLTLTEEVNQMHADFCHALADTRRLMILYTLADGEESVSAIAEKLSITQSSTSRHLKILRERGLVNAIRDGSSVRYSLSDARLIEALDLLRSIMRDRLMYRANLIGSEG